MSYDARFRLTDVTVLHRLDLVCVVRKHEICGNSYFGTPRRHESESLTWERANFDMPNTVPCGEFTVYYHEGFTGRSQGLEMMLVASKAKWKRAPWSEVKDPTCFAAPALGHDQTGKMISQTTAAAQWLGTEVGFRPPTGLRAEALKIALDIADVWSEAYKTRKDANSWEEVEAFLSGRLAQFFGVLEACAKKYGKDGVLVGAKTSYCDFLLVNAIATYAPRTSLAPRARTHASAVAAFAAR